MSILSFPFRYLAGNRARRDATKAASSLIDTISNGENPRLHAKQNVTTNNPIVMAKFGHALSAHCPCHVSSQARENGIK